MALIDLIGKLAPGFAARYTLNRRMYSEAKRLYDAATTSQYRSSKTNTTSGDGAMQLAGDKLRQMARHLEENHDLTVAIYDDLVNNSVGTGIAVSPMVRTSGGELAENTNQIISELWAEWSARPETTNQLGFETAERMLARSMFRDGEVFAQMVTAPGFNYPTLVPFALELLEADFIPFDLQSDDLNLLHGIEVNAWGAPTFYHIYKNHPGDPSLRYEPAAATKRVPASRMLHLKFSRRLRQRRGVPIVHSVINRLKDLHDYESSEMVAAKVAADMTAFITKNDHYAGTTAVNSANNREMRLSAGAIFELLPGEEVSTIKSDRPNSGLEDFRNAMLRAVAGGVGSRFSSIARNYNGTYSSQRQELVEGAIGYRAHSAYLIRQFHRPVYETFIDQAFYSGLIPRAGIDLNTIRRVDFRPPSLPWIDPQKEAKAWEMLVASKLESRAEIMRQRGRDPRKVVEEITAEQAIEAFAPEVAPVMATQDPAEVDDDEQTGTDG